MKEDKIMKYFIDKKEVDEKKFKQEIINRCLIKADKGEIKLNDDEKKIYKKANPLEKTLFECMIAKKEAKKYEDLNEFHLMGYIFKKENEQET
jgi:cytoplasmic iron level regulating protein YaaA (DUF328/UPF0246 family)